MNRIFTQLNLKLVLASFLVIGFLASCNDDDNDEPNDPEPTTFTLTQAELNSSTTNWLMNLTGGAIDHAGGTVDPDSSLRDVYGNTANANDIVNGKQVVTKRVYRVNSDGSKGNLMVTFAMFKREAGYYAEGGDWEYVMMPYDENNDYDANPNGMLPSEGEMRGKLASCAGCHSAAQGDDYLYSND